MGFPPPIPSCLFFYVKKFGNLSPSLPPPLSPFPSPLSLTLALLLLAAFPSPSTVEAAKRVVHMPSVRNPAEELRKARQLRQKAIEKQARIDALPQRKREERETKKREMAAIRALRLEREREEDEARRREMKAREEEREKERQKAEADERARLQKQFVDSLHACADDAPASSSACPRPVRKRVVQETEETAPLLPPPPPPSFFTPASIRHEISKYDHSDASRTPSFAVPGHEDVMNLATHRVLKAVHSDAGVSCWPLDSSLLASPSQWRSILSRINGFLMSSKRRNSLHVASGEYNHVMSGRDVLTSIVDAEDAERLSSSLDSEGAWDDVVVRITRPDQGSDDEDDEEQEETEGEKEEKEEKEDKETKKQSVYRYRSLCEMTTEMHSVLEAAAYGYGVACHACFLFPAGTRRRNVRLPDGSQCTTRLVQLYGSVYILGKASSTLNSVTYDRVVHANKSHREVGKIKDAIASGVEEFVTGKLLPKMVAQAKLGILNFDSKPGNLVLCSQLEVHLIDFDASLYSHLSPDECSWEGCLLLNILLLVAHSRAWHNTTFATAFANAFRPIVLELVLLSRRDRWVHECNVERVPFRPYEAKNATQARKKLCSVVTAYFLPSEEGEGATCHPPYKTAPCFQVGKPLLPQLAKFAIAGSSVSRDPDLARVFGEGA